LKKPSGFYGVATLQSRQRFGRGFGHLEIDRRHDVAEQRVGKRFQTGTQPILGRLVFVKPQSHRRERKRETDRDENREVHFMPD